MMSIVTHQLAVLASTAASTVRGWRGTMATQPAQIQPAKPLHLYDMEGCPYCRIVREAVAELDLSLEVYPCPKGGRHFRQEALTLAGVEQFPTLYDPNTEQTIVESADIVAYLFAQYGKRPVPLRLRKEPVTAMLASAMRVGHGLRYVPAVQPDTLLELYAFESSPYSRLVRERLTELELPYRLHSMGKEQVADIGVPGLRITTKKYEPVAGGKRANLQKIGGRIQVPYLVDPNTGTALYDSYRILRYLDETYRC